MAQHRPGEGFQMPDAPLPTPEQSAEMAHGVATMLAVINDAMAAVIESANGVRAQMLANDYSEEAAEGAAMQHIILAQQNLWGGARG